MNVDKPYSFMSNNKINIKFQKNKENKPQYSITKKESNTNNKYQSDKKLKQNNSPYYIIHKKISSATMPAENQIILLQKRDLEIKDLKLKCQKLEQENHKYQLQNILLKNNSNNIKNNNYISENNTSSNFPIINEIKKLWENLAKVEILNNFIEFENEPEIIYHIICSLISLSDKMIKKHCLLKYQEILKIMGVKNNLVIIKDIEIQFKNFMKEHLSEIFNYLKDKSFINDYKNQLKNNVKNSIRCINENNMIILEDILEQNEFNDILKNINDIILFTQFHEPALFFPIEEMYEKRKVKYIQINNNNKKDYILVNDTNFSGNKKSIVLLEPPCLKSGFVFYNELKPIIMIIEQNYDNSKDIIMNNENEIIEEKIKYNSINTTSRINRNLNPDKINIYSNGEKNNHNKDDIKKNEFSDYNKATIDNDSYYENKNVITIKTSRPVNKKIKTAKKLSISKDIKLEDPDFCSNEEFGYLDKNNQKLKKVILSNKKYNKICRIKSANNYLDKKKKNKNKEKIKFSKQNTNIIKKIETYKLYNNNFKKNLKINNNENGNSKKNIIVINYSDGNQSLSNKKNNKNITLNKYLSIPLTFKKYIKNKKLNNKIYNSVSNKKDNLAKNKKCINKTNNKSSNNNIISQKSKTKINININTNNSFYKNEMLIKNNKRNEEIISPSNTKKIDFFIDNDKKNCKKKKYNNNNNKNVKKNYNDNINSNSNILKNNYNSHSNKHFSNLATNRPKKSAKRLDSFDLKNSLVYSTIEEIKKMIDDVYHPHKPKIIISTNSNINYNFNKKNTNKRKNNYNTINNSIKQLISLSQPKIIEKGNINHNIYSDNKNSKLNTKSFETINNCNYNNYIANKDLYYKQFSIDETTFNTSSQFNNTHECNNKTNKNFNQFGKKSKENKTLPNDINNKFNPNINNNFKTKKNKIREIEINIDGLSNNNFNTINAQPNKNRYNKFFHIFDNNI